MKHVYSTLLAATLAFASTAAQAGGPVMIEEEVEVVAEKSGSSIGILPIIIITIGLCAALCGGDDDEEQPPPPPPS